MGAAFGPRRMALLPLYLDLYDQAFPDLLPRQERFIERVAESFRSWGLGIVKLPVCRTRRQITTAVSSAEGLEVDCLVTLHLSYSPATEAVEPLVRTPLPLLLLDTTPASNLREITTNTTLENHGIQGVQDLACVLTREGRQFFLAVGPVDSLQFRTEVDRFTRAAQALRVLREIRVAQIGTPAPGMVDFSISRDMLVRAVGCDTTSIEIARVAQMTKEVTAEDLAAESAADTEVFDCQGCDPDCWNRSNRVGLGLRRALREAEIHAFTFNVADFDERVGTPTVPFFEASKAMARGLGYAGDGDVLTAALVAALASSYGPTTFTKMVCPDWEGGRIFMNCMGEMNPLLAKGRPRLVEQRYRLGKAADPAVLIFPVRPGPATLVDLCPCDQDRLRLITADVEVLEPGAEPGVLNAPHFWMAPPAGSAAGFLRRYSEAGGTHHLALTPGARAADFAALAAMKDWESVHIA